MLLLHVTYNLCIKSLFLSVIPASNASGILPERVRTSRNDRNLELWQPEVSASKRDHWGIIIRENNFTTDLLYQVPQKAFLSLSTASFILPTGTVNAKRTYPSPGAPKPLPGVVSTPALSRICATKLEESNCFGTFAHK